MRLETLIASIGVAVIVGIFLLMVLVCGQVNDIQKRLDRIEQQQTKQPI
jgi:hypothetical protein